MRDTIEVRVKVNRRTGFVTIKTNQPKDDAEIALCHTIYQALHIQRKP